MAKKPVKKTTWYRGTASRENPKRKRKPTYWTTNRSEAKQYAKIPIWKKGKGNISIGYRPGKIISATVTPEVVFKGSDGELARKYRIPYRKYKPTYTNLREDYRRDVAFHREARKKGLDARLIDGNQLMVLNPKILTIKKETPLKLKRRKKGKRK